MCYNKDVLKRGTTNLKGIDTMSTTKKDYFAILRASYPETASNYAEVIAFIDHEVDLLTKKSGGEKKPTAQQTANESIKTAIIEGMTKNRLYTVTEIQKEISECAELSNQRVSALLRQLKDENKVVRTEDKRKAYFSLA